MGSASGVLQATNGLAMSIGVGRLGAIFYGLVDSKGVRERSFVHAAEWTSLLTVARLAAAFAIAIKRPRRARRLDESQVVAEDESGPFGAGDPVTAEDSLALDDLALMGH